MRKFPFISCILLFSVFGVNGCNSKSEKIENHPKIAGAVSAGVLSVTWADYSISNNILLRESDVRIGLEVLENHDDYSGFILLMLLLENEVNVPNDLRISILSSALQNYNFHNDWGFFDSSSAYDGPAALALVECGESAIPSLVDLLGVDRQIQITGSEEATIVSLNQLRVSDYAHRYLCLIKGVPHFFTPRAEYSGEP